MFLGAEQSGARHTIQRYIRIDRIQQHGTHLDVHPTTECMYSTIGYSSDTCGAYSWGVRAKVATETLHPTNSRVGLRRKETTGRFGSSAPDGEGLFTALSGAWAAPSQHRHRPGGEPQRGQANRTEPEATRRVNNVDQNELLMDSKTATQSRYCGETGCHPARVVTAPVPARRRSCERASTQFVRIGGQGVSAQPTAQEPTASTHEAKTTRAARPWGMHRQP